LCAWTRSSGLTAGRMVTPIYRHCRQQRVGPL
jgi:hypothetical protein